MSDYFNRISKINPCPICKKTDWCLIAHDGAVAICARVQVGSIKRCGEAGWLHKLKGDSSGLRPRSKSRRIVLYQAGKDFRELAERYANNLSETRLNVLADSLAVSAESLRRLGLGWDGDAYTFPMGDGAGRVIGLQRRFLDGRKLCVTGSRLGLFVPADLSDSDALMVCEGMSDTGAALDRGFDAVGRASCKTGGRLLSQFAKGRDVIIVGDGDEVGREGAERLARQLVLVCRNVRVISPPDGIKDLRSWKQGGATHEDIKAAIEIAEPKHLTIRGYNERDSY